MSKKDKMLEALTTLLDEYSGIQNVIASLPRGYISKKVISGHVYHYRQWREGTHVLSDYVPETLLNGVRQKIVIRKENEELLKIIKKDIKKLERQLLKAAVLTEEEVLELNQKYNFK